VRLKRFRRPLSDPGQSGTVNLRNLTFTAPNCDRSDRWWLRRGVAGSRHRCAAQRGI